MREAGGLRVQYETRGESNEPQHASRDELLPGARDHPQATVRAAGGHVGAGRAAVHHAIGGASVPGGRMRGILRECCESPTGISGGNVVVILDGRV